MNHPTQSDDNPDGRTIAIGDIHGCATALTELIKLIELRPQDTLVPLGDFVDRGNDSRGVLDTLIELKGACRLVPILGNHDEMMLTAKHNREMYEFWLSCGGEAALASYGETERYDLIPKRHLDFLSKCSPYFETATHIFTHANYIPDKPFAQMDAFTLRWLSLRDFVPAEPHRSGKTVVVGHTPQHDVWDLGRLVCLDTGCFRGGWLTAWEAGTGCVWQVNEQGQQRNGDEREQ